MAGAATKVGPLPPGARDAAVALWRGCGLTRPWNDADADYARAVVGPTSTVLGIFDDAGVLVGTVMVGDDGHRGWLYYLAVDPTRRRAGLGRALVMAAEGWLAARGSVKAQLMVRGDNRDAVGFYEAMGYERADVVVLGRRLDGAA